MTGRWSIQIDHVRHGRLATSHTLYVDEVELDERTTALIDEALVGIDPWDALVELSQRMIDGPAYEREASRRGVLAL